MVYMTLEMVSVILEMVYVTWEMVYATLEIVYVTRVATNRLGMISELKPQTSTKTHYLVYSTTAHDAM